MSAHVRARRTHTPPRTCAYNTAVVFVIQRGQSCGKQGECSAERHNGVSHSRHTHTHKPIAIDARRRLPPVPLVTLKGVSSGTHGSQRQQIEHRLAAPHRRSSSVTKSATCFHLSSGWSWSWGRMQWMHRKECRTENTDSLMNSNGIVAVWEGAGGSAGGASMEPSVLAVLLLGPQWASGWKPGVCWL